MFCETAGSLAGVSAVRPHTTTQRPHTTKKTKKQGHHAAAQPKPKPSCYQAVANRNATFSKILATLKQPTAAGIKALVSNPNFNGTIFVPNNEVCCFCCRVVLFMRARGALCVCPGQN